MSAAAENTVLDIAQIELGQKNIKEVEQWRDQMLDKAEAAVTASHDESQAVIKEVLEQMPKVLIPIILEYGRPCIPTTQWPSLEVLCERSVDDELPKKLWAMRSALVRIDPQLPDVDEPSSNLPEERNASEIVVAYKDHANPIPDLRAYLANALLAYSEMSFAKRGSFKAKKRFISFCLSFSSKFNALAAQFKASTLVGANTK